MSSAPPSNAPAKPDGPKPLMPPDEQFWKRYSPHSEFPLSTAGSVAVHLLALGGLVLFAFYLAYLDKKSNRTLPVEPVRLLEDGGGGGEKGGTPGEGGGVGGAVEDTGDGKDDKPTAPKEKVERPPLTKVERKDMKEQFDPAALRYLRSNETDNARSFVRLEESLRRKLKPGDGATPGAGRGGSGTGGGKGSGTGTGTGGGKGPGKEADRAQLTQREKRMLRWTMRFNTSSGADYVKQLAALGAILAIPVGEGPEPQLKVIRNLTKPPAQLLDEERPLDRIYWIDSNPKTVQDVMTYLQVPGQLPRQFIAFMPQELEKQLFQMEKDYMQRVLRVKYNEDRIYETVFRVVPEGGGYRAQILSVRLKLGAR